MGHVLIGAFGMAFCFGLNGTLESKVSKAFKAGSADSEPEMCGVWLNRGRVINTFLMIPMMGLFAFSDHILMGIGIQ